ncbi:basic helix-loop-helix protein, partial [Coemansia guatemalensis]
MSTSSPSSSVLLAVEDKGPSTRSSNTQYAAIAPRTTAASTGPTAIVAAVAESHEEAIAGSSNNSNTEFDTPGRRKRGRDGLEPGSPEWQRMRRDSHKEVERRRREVINHGIDSLAELIPGAEKNKGRIIAQAVDYIGRLRANEEKNIEKWTIEKLLADQAISELTSQVEQLKAENKRLKAQVKSGADASVSSSEDEPTANIEENPLQQTAGEDAEASGEAEATGSTDKSLSKR